MELSEQSVVRYLAGRHLLTAEDRTTVEALGGGVSCTVLAVATDRGERYIVKQALPKLRVSDTWLASPERGRTEAAALLLVGKIAPTSVPRVLDFDVASNIVTLECAPSSWRNWKGDLLAGHVDVNVAEWLGQTLADIHTTTAADVETRSMFDQTDAFEQLRIAPYYRTTAARLPELAGAINERIDRLSQRRLCLVHGDFSPKNVLVGPGGRWVIDFEVAHFGSPVFDLGFLVNHLLLKAIFRRELADRYLECAQAFLDTYQIAVAKPLREPISEILAEAGCLMLSRVDGKSPAEYLTEPQREDARRLGRKLLTNPPPSLSHVPLK
jgi:5-methylthioribose kinase